MTVSLILFPRKILNIFVVFPAHKGNELQPIYVTLFEPFKKTGNSEIEKKFKEQEKFGQLWRFHPIGSEISYCTVKGFATVFTVDKI